MKTSLSLFRRFALVAVVGGSLGWIWMGFKTPAAPEPPKNSIHVTSESSVSNPSFSSLPIKAEGDPSKLAPSFAACAILGAIGILQILRHRTA